jgi:hypothetical protein
MIIILLGVLFGSDETLSLVLTSRAAKRTEKVTQIFAFCPGYPERFSRVGLNTE